jgi:DNA polymerase III epsilon subunit-like protein
MSEVSTIGFDLETTSADSDTTVPVQICMVLQTGTTRRVLVNGFTNPMQPIHPDATAVHGITNDAVASAPDYAIAAWSCRLLVQSLQPTFVTGYNIESFDLPIINRCCGAPVFEGCQVLDVQNIVMRYFPTLEGFKLGQVYERFIGRPLAGAHDASADVIGTLDVLNALLPLVQMSLSDLAEDMKTPRPYSVMPIGKYKGRLLKDVPRSWFSWMKINASNMRPDLKATVDSGLR